MQIKTNEMQPFEKEHLEKLRALAPECMVLLKKNGDFPLTAPCKIALYGSGARETIKGGTGSGDVNVRHYVTVEEGLENAGYSITTKTWLDSYSAAKAAGKARFYEELAAEAKAAGKSALLIGMGRVPAEPRYEFPIDGEGEVCVYVLARNSGEGSDRPGNEGDLLLTEDETRDILCCAEKYEKFLLVLNVGGPVDLSPVLDQVHNILLMSQLGSVTGDAFADVLSGRAYPSGRLTATWARAEDYSKIGDFGEMDDTRYKEGIFVGYRYFDAAGVKPLFPFGYGLGYSDFAVRTEQFTVEDHTVTVTVRVENTGVFDGRETVCLYYSAPEGKLVKPLRELGAYRKTGELKPGECENMTLTLPVEDMASWDNERNEWLLEKGAYVISVDETAIGIVMLEEDVYTARGHAAGGETDFQDWVPDRKREIPQGLPMAAVNAMTLKQAGHYDRERMAGEKLELPDLTGFTDGELAAICVGKHHDAQGAAAIIGNSASRVAGGGGESADVVAEKGYGALVMADGPAGLRLAKQYVETERGAESLDRDALGWMLELLPEQFRQLILAKYAENEKKAAESTVLYHYASAIPIGTALAQSWNPAVAEECGSIVGREMELFGVNIWLAPALNIQRSPLCGRNFEYYSEDPVVSGRTAAAVVKGVQKHGRCGVTIKHFACNNQETNRFGSNSIVSGRALREIYLKGFEICVKESAPKALMTSYNLLNGIHTANKQDLLNEVLRLDWGFEGIVMTDWGTTGDSFNRGIHGCSDPGECIKAGNDLIMPGGKPDVDGILSAIESGRLTRKELEACAARVLAMSRKLSIC